MSNRLPHEAVEIMARLLVDTYVIDDVVQKGLDAADRIEAMFLQRRSGGTGKARRSTSTAQNVVYYSKREPTAFAGDE